MAFLFSNLNFKQKGNVAEIFYLSVIGILSPFAVGLQTWSIHTIPYTLSLVVINVLQLPVIVLFYRLYLPLTVGKKRYILFSALLPIYLLLYGLNERLSIGATMALPFIPEGYKALISGARPWDFTQGYFNTNPGYTILVLLAATSLYVIKLLFKNQQQLFTVETEKLKLELNHLKSQVQPHFFFNTLNNLYSLSLQYSLKTPQMINDLSGIMRYVLYDTTNEKVPLTQEVEFIKSYINLENLRHDEINVIDFSTQGDLNNTEIEPLLLLPLIENTFKHALNTNAKNKWVKLILTVDEDELVFQTSNPIAIQSINIDRSKSGIGLSNVKKRMELLYPEKHELLIDEENNIFTVSLTIMLNHN